WRQRSRLVPARRDAPLDAFAGGPILSVRDVPEVHGVRGVEAIAIGGLRRKEPFTRHAGTPRVQWLEQMRHDVVGVNTEQWVRHDLDVEPLAEAIRGQASHGYAAAVPGQGHGLGALGE